MYRSIPLMALVFALAGCGAGVEFPRNRAANGLLFPADGKLETPESGRLFTATEQVPYTGSPKSFLPSGGRIATVPGPGGGPRVQLFEETLLF